MATLNDLTALLVSVSASVEGIAGDIQVLNDKITALQNGGGFTPEQQAEIDSLAAGLQAVQVKAAALDDLTPSAG